MNRLRLMSLAFLALILASALAGIASAEPSGPEIITNVTEAPTPRSAGSVTTAGGTFTTLLLNATTQTMRWKAYVGNVTGNFKLQDASNATIYDWSVSTIAGEVYASRNSSIDWSQIRCAAETTLQTEQAQLDIVTTKDDSINRTFNGTVHRGFYVGTRLVANSSCRSIATYVNNTRQAASEAATFQEILLDDTDAMVYVTLLENKRQGYNNEDFDFQMIVPESDIKATPSTYYFWVELS